jgi:hypothetical protein
LVKYLKCVKKLIFFRKLKICKDNQSEEEPYSVYVFCKERNIEYWFCKAKITLYSKENDEVDEFSMVNSVNSSVYPGKLQLHLGSTNLSKIYPTFFVVVVEIMQRIG